MPINEDDFDEMLEEPLMTEDGSVNEACLNELDAAIHGMPKSYYRLANDEEWSTERWTNKRDILAAFAKSATMLSPYPCPDNLEAVIKYLDTCLNSGVEWDNFGANELNLCCINKLLYDILYDQGIEYFDDWNKPKKNWRDSDFRCFDEAERNDPDYGFIDLDALLHNTCLDIRMERRAFDKFNAEFEKNNPECKSD